MVDKTWAQKFDERNANNLMFLLEMHKTMVFAAIRVRMHAGGVSQKDIAEKLDVSEAWVSKFLNREPDVRLSTLVKVAWALNCKWAVPSLEAEPPGHEHLFISKGGRSAKVGIGGYLVDGQAIEKLWDVHDWHRVGEWTSSAPGDGAQHYRADFLEQLGRAVNQAAWPNTKEGKRSHHGKEEPAERLTGCKLATAA